MSFVRVELVRIVIDEKRQDQVIVLKEKDGDRQFPIMIGLVEASSIKMRLSGVDVPRPLTHDLMMDVINELQASLIAVEIDDLDQGTFFAKLVIETEDGDTVRVDARPSDGIALAVRAQVPVFVAEEVLGKVAIGQAE